MKDGSVYCWQRRAYQGLALTELTFSNVLDFGLCDLLLNRTNCLRVLCIYIIARRYDRGPCYNMLDELCLEVIVNKLDILLLNIV